MDSASIFPQFSKTILVLLMFIGASPGSTGGGIKTSTLFVMCNVIRSVIFNKRHTAFRRRIADSVIMQAFVVTLLSFCIVAISTFLLCVLEPEYSFMQLLFETVSGFGTVGLSTGITPSLSVASKLVIILTMYIGRLGAFTLLSIWIDRPEPSVHYTEEIIMIG